MKIYYLYHQTRQVAPAALNPAALEAEAIARGLAGYKIEARTRSGYRGSVFARQNRPGNLRTGIL